jgi:hypothetical protein
VTTQQKLARGAVIAAIAAIAAMWIYAFGFASKEAAAHVEDRAWTTRAAEICDRRNELLEDNAEATRETGDGTPQSVGRGVAVATDLIEAALGEVVAVLPESTDDVAKIDEFERLYRIYIADRRAAETKLLGGEEAELNETTLNGSPISETIADFTKPNDMEACAPPPTF